MGHTEAVIRAGVPRACCFLLYLIGRVTGQARLIVSICQARLIVSIGQAKAITGLGGSCRVLLIPQVPTGPIGQMASDPCMDRDLSNRLTSFLNK